MGRSHESFARYVKARAQLLGKSQKTLAQELQVSPAYISQLLTGKKHPPDLGRPRNRAQLSVWSASLQVSESDLLDIVRHDLHKIPLKPTPRFPKMRCLLLQRLNSQQSRLADEIKHLELHPGEARIIDLLTRIYLFAHQHSQGHRAYAPARLRTFTVQARTNRHFVEEALLAFVKEKPFQWAWDGVRNEADIDTDSGEIREALKAVNSFLSSPTGGRAGVSVPIVGHVSAGEGFEYTDGGYTAGEGFEQVAMPPGVNESLAQRLYCVRVRGNSLSDFFGDGTLLFVKPESWEEIRDGDLVIFKDRTTGKAFVKKTRLSGEEMILRSMNPHYGDMTMKKSDLMLLERVVAVVF